MEAASSIFYGDKSVTGERSTRWRNVVIHELAHQWFGNSVTEYDWDDVWLSEGFATYFTLLFIEHAYGRDEFVGGFKKSRVLIMEFYKEQPDYRIVHDQLSDMSKVSNRMTYQKGAWFLHMLRNKMGDVDFRKGIRSYYRKYYNGNASTSDLIHEMESASGQKLSRTFQQWLYQGGNPKLSVEWNYYSNKNSLEIVLSQTQESGCIFNIPVEIEIVYGEKHGSKVETLNLAKESESFTIHVEHEPVKLIVDPYTKLLAEWAFSEKEEK
jgi:aminopeptidase N